VEVKVSTYVIHVAVIKLEYKLSKCIFTVKTKRETNMCISKNAQNCMNVSVHELVTKVALYYCIMHISQALILNTVVESYF
jgi:hypothetical protein